MLERQAEILRMLSAVLRGRAHAPAGSAATALKPPDGWDKVKGWTSSPVVKVRLKRLGARGASGAKTRPKGK